MIDRACISLTSKCQLNCVYCHFDKHIDKSDCADMESENLRTVLKNIKNYAEEKHTAFKIGLVGSGEPLLRFDLIKESVAFLNEIDAEKTISLYTISNGIHCTKEILQFFYQNRQRIKFCFSLDGGKEIHNTCRRFKNGNGTFDKVMESIDLYKSIFNESPSINATVHKLTVANSEKTLPFFENNFSEVCFSRLVDEPAPELYISKAEFNSFMEKAMKTKLSLRQCRKPQKYDCTMYGQLCGVGRTNIFYANGKVYPCGRFIGNEKFCLGNETDSLFDIEKNMAWITPCKDGDCYFDENIARSSF
ncbi:MAG: radical SAM protein [Treponema sp.]|nr:radical SAM protein [Treponema sp.]